MNKKCFLLTILLLTSSAAPLLGRPITVESADGTQFKVEEGVLKTSKVLGNMLEDCGGSPEEVHLGKSAEEFQLILPLLESIHESKDDILGQLSVKEPLEMARIIELANFFDVQQVIDHGSDALKERFDSFCGQHQENLDGALRSFLESMKPLSPEMNQVIAGKIIENHQLADCLFNSCHIPQKILRSVGWVSSVCLYCSQDDDHLFTGSADGEVRMWNKETGECVRTFNGHTGFISSVALGGYLATGSADGEVRMWNEETGECVCTLSEHADHILFSPDNKYLATVSDDGSIKIWNVETSQCIKILENHIIGCHCSLSFSPDGQYLTADNQKWNVETGQCIETSDGHTDCCHCCCSDGQCFTDESEDDKTRIRNVDDRIDELDRFLCRDITLEQAVVLILFYENRNNKTFRCPDYLEEDFKLLPENIKKLIPGNIKAYAPAFVRVWSCYSLGQGFPGCMFINQRDLWKRK